MAEVKKYKVGDELTYKPINQRVKVIHNTLKAGAVNAAEAFVTIRTKQNSIINVPVAVQEDYLTTESPKSYAQGKWPLPKQ